MRVLLQTAGRLVRARHGNTRQTQLPDHTRGDQHGQTQQKADVSAASALVPDSIFNKTDDRALHDVEQVEVVQIPLRDPALQLVSAQKRVDVRVDVGMSLEVFLQAAFQFPEIRRIVVARRYFVQGAALFLPIF